MTSPVLPSGRVNARSIWRKEEGREERIPVGVSEGGRERGNGTKKKATYHQTSMNGEGERLPYAAAWREREGIFGGGVCIDTIVQ